jgi:hypothetical protein
MHFVETMRGQLSRDGVVTPVCFHVRAERRAGGEFSLAGVVHAAPWVAETTVTGTLHLAMLPPRIAYDVRFTATDGRALALRGAKHPTPLSPVNSMSELSCALVDVSSNEVLASGQLAFDLLDLPKFLASWLPGRSREHRRLEAQHHAVARRALMEG